MTRSPNNVTPTYEIGYLHGRREYPRPLAPGGDYARGYRDGLHAAANAPAPPHSENDDLSERTTA